MNVGKEEIYMAFHFDENVWYMIPKFNGYEIKRIPEGFIVRSFKNFNKYPNGYILPYEHKHGDKSLYYFEMTASDGKRMKLNISEILDIMDEFFYYAIPQKENATNMNSRNKIVSNTGSLFKKKEK